LEDLVRVDELSELWRSHWDAVMIEGSDTDDCDDGSLPELLDGSDFDERDQDFAIPKCFNSRLEGNLEAALADNWQMPCIA
jgi:hypothetical protein